MNIINDFPNTEQFSYFDSACVTKKPNCVIEAMQEYYTQFPACAGRSTHTWASQVTKKVEQARKNVQKLLNAKNTEEIIFTKNTTEGINLIANGLSFNSVVTTDKEHNSNLLPWMRMAKEGKITHTIVEPEQFIDETSCKQLCEAHDIIAIHHTSNIDGSSLPIAKIIKIAHKHNTQVLIDAAQSVGHAEIDVKKLDVDLLVCSGHKMLGPSGTGILYGKKNILQQIKPTYIGGDTVEDVTVDGYTSAQIPHTFEAGLQDYAGIIGLGEAAKYIQKLGIKKIRKHSLELNQQLTKAMAKLPVDILGPENPEDRPSIVTIIPNSLNIHELNLLLSQQGILTRSGAFCAHAWFNKHKLPGGVRFSLHCYTTQDDIHKVIEYLYEIKELL